MNYKRICLTWLIAICVFLVGYFTLLIVVDPLGIIGTPDIIGFNQYKTKQNSYRYVWKPYLALNNQAKVLFIGSSRVYIGWHPSLKGYKDEECINFGMDGMTIPNLKTYLDFLLQHGHFEKIFLGVDFFQFGQNSFYSKEGDFSQTRLDVISGGSRTNILCQAIKDSVGVGFVGLLTTIKDSWKHRADEKRAYIRGFDGRRGNAVLDDRSNEWTLRNYERTYGNFVYEPKSLEVFEQVVEQLQGTNVDFFVFVNPKNKALCEMLCRYGHEAQWNKIKQHIRTKIGRLYELHDAGKYIGNDENFYDASHYNRKIGDVLKKQIMMGIEN